MPEFHAAIFDIDGTLIDSMNMWTAIDDEFLTKRGMAIPSDYQTAIAAMQMPQAAAYTCELFKLRQSPESLMAEWLDMARVHYEKDIPLKPFAGEYLRLLKRAGVKLCTASSMVPEMFGPCLKRLGIYELFDAFAMVHEVARGKHEPDLFLLAASKVGVAPGECIVYDDLHQCMCSGHSAGMITCGVYDSSPAHVEALVRRFADRYIYSFEEELRRYQGSV